MIALFSSMYSNLTQQLADSVSTTCPEYSLTIRRALTFAEHAHQEQFRDSGEPFFIHPLTVARELWYRFSDPELTIAGLLHDTVEDCPFIFIEQIYTLFGDKVGFMVDAVTKHHTGFFHRPELFFPQQLERFLWAGMQDSRVFLLKLADRNHNMHTLSGLSKERQHRLHLETLALYVPLKALLQYHGKCSAHDIQFTFQEFLHTQHLTTPEALKQYLFTASYTQCERSVYPELTSFLSQYLILQ